jgi:hypothetical protein
MLGSSRAMPIWLGGFTFKSNKWFMDAWRSSKCSRLELKWLTHIFLHQTLESSTNDLDLIKSGWGELKRLVFKWSGTSNPRERGWSDFYRNLKKLAVGAVRVDQSYLSTIPVKPVWRLQTSSGHSLKKSLSDDTIGLGPGHVRRRAGQVRWSSNYNGHKVHRICLVQDQTCPKNLSVNRPSNRTCMILGT